MRKNSKEMSTIAADGFDVRNPDTCLAQVRENEILLRTECPQPHRQIRIGADGRDEIRIYWAGLRSLLERAAKEFTEATGKMLPWNLAGPSWAGFRTEPVAGSDWKFRLPNWATEARYEEVVADYRRFAGWLNAAQELPGVRAMIGATQDWGMNCPGVTNLWEVFRRFPSPGHLERALWATLHRAKQIAKPFGVERIGWGSVLPALMKNHDPRRAAFAVAADVVWAVASITELGGCHTIITGRPIERLMKCRGLREARRLTDEQRMWAVARVEAGEFACLRDAVPYAESRLIKLTVTDEPDQEYWVDRNSAVQYQGLANVVSYDIGYNGGEVSAKIAVYRRRNVEHIAYCDANHAPQQVMLDAARIPGSTGKETIRRYWGEIPMDGETLLHYVRRLTAAALMEKMKISRWSPVTSKLTLAGLRAAMRVSPAVCGWAIDRIETGEFKSLTEALCNAGRLIKDATDGVAALVDPTFDEVIHRVSVRTAWVDANRHIFGDGGNGGKKVFVLTQNGTGRTFHCESSQWFPAEHCHREPTPSEAVKTAIKAWRKQAELAKEEKSFLDKFYTEGFCPIVYFQDSREAGNCKDGTESFMIRVGIPATRRFIPAHTLFPYLGEQRVRNTLALVARKVSALRLAA